MFTLYNDRFDPKYDEHLLDRLSDIDGLIKSATAPGKPRSDTDGKFIKGIQIDFAGLAATTLLGVDIEGESKSPLKAKIAARFHELLSTKTTDFLASKGIYLKVRFIFSYIYSSFAKSLIEAEAALGRPRGNDRRIVYNFDIQSSISEDMIKASTLYRSQVSSLKKIAALAEANRRLVMSLPEYYEHTLQVRFSVLPMPFCLMIVNDKTYSDPYLYAQEKVFKGVRNLFYHSPVQVFASKDRFQRKYYSYLTNHFDYLWNNELALYCKDATEFENNEPSYMGLSRIRKPTDLRFDQKERRIADYLRKNRKSFDDVAIERWRNNIVRKLPIYLGEEVKIAPRRKTADPEPPTLPSSSGQPGNSIAIGKQPDGQYFFYLSLPAEKVTVHYKNKRPELLYKVMLHIAIATSNGVNPVIHRRHKYGRRRLLRNLLNPMTHIATNDTHPAVIDMNFLETYIVEPSRENRLRVLPENIQITPDWDKWAKDLTYQAHNPNITHQVIVF